MKLNRIWIALGLISCVYSMSSNAFHDQKFSDEYKFEKDCVALYSLMRDLTYSVEGNTDKYNALTEAQNKLYLKHPSGHFKPKHVDAAKFLHKQRLAEKGESYLQESLRECGVK